MHLIGRVAAVAIFLERSSRVELLISPFNSYDRGGYSLTTTSCRTCDLTIPAPAPGWAQRGSSVRVEAECGSAVGVVFDGPIPDDTAALDESGGVVTVQAVGKPPGPLSPARDGWHKQRETAPERDRMYWRRNRGATIPDTRVGRARYLDKNPMESIVFGAGDRTRTDDILLGNSMRPSSSYLCVLIDIP